MLRLHMSPSAAGDTRDLLAASLQATSQAITAHAAMLSLPVVDDAAAQALPADSAVRDRLQEVEFAEASQALRALVQKGDARGARKLLKDLQARFAQRANGKKIAEKGSKITETGNVAMKLISDWICGSVLKPIAR